MSITYDDNYSRAAYIADVGYVFPLKYDDGSNGIKIRNFLDTPNDIQLHVANAFMPQWGNDDGMKNSDDYIKFIEKTWRGSDVMYVMTKNGKFIGTVAIDRNNFYPFISYVYVTPEERGNSYSKTLIKVAELHAKNFGFNEVRLWCVSDMQTFYTKQGYVEEKTGVHHNRLHHLMVKKTT